MKIIKAHVNVDDKIDGKNIILKLENIGRTCWQSDRSENDTPEDFVRRIIKRGHTSVLEHVSISFDIITDRGVLAELTRHRIASYSVESTRYVKYDKGNMEFIDPVEIPHDNEVYDAFLTACEECEHLYITMMGYGEKAQTARAVLNQSLKTEIRFTANLRSLRNFFGLRCDKGAHPHIKEIAIPMLLWCQDAIPVVFDDIGYDKDFAEKYLVGDRDWRNMVTNNPIV